MIPLAAQLRPKDLGEFIGQEHLVGKGKPLRQAIEQKHLMSFVLWGPPGSGKTTLARIYAKAVDGILFELSAVSAGKADVKQVVEQKSMKQKILFIDEIHRFNKAQQDFLLPYVESGEVVFIGATTENPSFEVISPLLSRCQVFILKPHTEEDLQEILAKSGVKMDQEAQEWLIRYANGDARRLLTLLESATQLYGKRLTVKTLQNALQTFAVRYDKKGEAHYDSISAFIKSMRASQPDAALYYLARMLEGGEDPKFIARRMVIFASEDIGLAQPTALVVANEVFQAVESVGMPECGINLAHAAAYLALAKKSRASYEAFPAAQADVQAYGELPVPLKIRNPVTKLMKGEGYGKGYKKYDEESYLPDKLKGKKYFIPDAS